MFIELREFKKKKKQSYFLLVNDLIKKGHIGIGEKAQETSVVTGMHNNVSVPLLYHMNSVCVLEYRDDPHDR